MSEPNWTVVPHDLVRAEPMQLVGKWVRLSNPTSGVHVEGKCTNVAVDAGSDPIFTLTQVGWPADGKWQLKPAGSWPEFAVLCEMAQP